MDIIVVPRITKICRISNETNSKETICIWKAKFNNFYEYCPLVFAALCYVCVIVFWFLVDVLVPFLWAGK